MAVRFEVSSLGGERVCEVAGHLAWTGRQLKLAIDEATGAALLYCQQELFIGPSRVADNSVLRDLVPEADVDAGKPVQVSYVKGGEDPRILRDCADRRRLSQSLLAFEGSPTRLVFTNYGCHLAVDIACTEEHDEGQLHVIPMQAAEDLGYLPLSVFGIAEADISAILCLAGSFGSIVDHHGLAFAFQLTCGDVVGGFMRVCQAMKDVSYAPISVSVSHRASCAADVVEALPQLLGTRCDALPGVRHITVDVVRLEYYYSDRILRERVQDEGWPRGRGDEDDLEPDILQDFYEPPHFGDVVGGRDFELLQACQHLRLPNDMYDELVWAHGIDCNFIHALGQVGVSVSGKGIGRCSGLTWEELLDILRAKLPKGEAAHPYYETVLDRATARAEMGARPTTDDFNAGVSSCVEVAKDLVLGGKKAVDYDEWVRDRAAAAAAKTAALAAQGER